MARDAGDGSHLGEQRLISYEHRQGRGRLSTDGLPFGAIDYAAVWFVMRHDHIYDSRIAAYVGGPDGGSERYVFRRPMPSHQRTRQVHTGAPVEYSGESVRPEWGCHK